MSAAPNLLTLLRVPLGVALPFVVHSPGWFTALFGLALVSDVVDGAVARRLGVAGPTGARLDTAADVVLYAGAMTAALLALSSSSRVVAVAVIGIVAVLRGAGLVTARRRFGRWASLHTTTNRIAGAVTAATVVVVVWTGDATIWLLVAAGLVAAISAVEEVWILSTSTHLDLDCRGFRDATRRPSSRSSGGGS